jgi:putative selenate reductase
MQLTNDRDASGRRVVVDAPDADFDIPVDTLILAISQHAVLDFLEDEPIALNDRGYIKVDPQTCETSIPGIYAGGDVANDGPATIVKAAAAGKAIASSILNEKGTVTLSEKGTVTFYEKWTSTLDSGEKVGEKVTVPLLKSGEKVTVPLLGSRGEMVRRRSQRERRIRAPQTHVAERQNFSEVMLTYTPEQARTEAARCLDCHTYCSICVGVCPNLALFTYETDRRDQHYQVAVLADLCNECGNCTTFCPTSGAPYRDKPRLYVNRDDFEAQQDNAFMIFHDSGNWAIEARFHGATRHLELNDPQDNPDAQQTAMYTILKGVQQSMPFLPMREA